MAGVAQSYKVAIARHAVGTTGTCISTSDGALIKVLHVIYKVDLLQCVAQRQTNCSTGRANVLERSCCRQTGSSLQLLNKLPGIESVEEIDISRTTVDDFDR